MLFRRLALGTLATLVLSYGCGGNVVVDTPSATTTGTGATTTATGTDTSGIGCTSDLDCSAGAVCDTATGTCVSPDPSSCHICACIDLVSMGGCADICSEALNGTSTPNFCDGVPALAQCAACLEQVCGVTNPMDPSSCM